MLETPTSTKELVEVCDAGRSTIISVATALLTHAMKPLLFVVVLASTTEASHDERRKLTFSGISAFSPANVNRNYTHYATALHTDLIGDASGYDRTVPASSSYRSPQRGGGNGVWLRRPPRLGEIEGVEGTEHACTCDSHGACMRMQ